MKNGKAGSRIANKHGENSQLSGIKQKYYSPLAKWSFKNHPYKMSKDTTTDLRYMNLACLQTSQNRKAIFELIPELTPAEQEK